MGKNVLALLHKIFDTVHAPYTKLSTIMHTCKMLTTEIMDIRLFLICTKIPFKILNLCHLIGTKLKTAQLCTAQLQHDCGHEGKKADLSRCSTGDHTAIRIRCSLPSATVSSCMAP